MSPFLRLSNYFKVHENYHMCHYSRQFKFKCTFEYIIITYIDDINYRKSAVIWSCEQGRGWINVANVGEMEVVALRAVYTLGPSSQYQVAPCHVGEVWPWSNIHVLISQTIKLWLKNSVIQTSSQRNCLQNAMRINALQGKFAFEIWLNKEISNLSIANSTWADELKMQLKAAALLF